MRSQTLYEAFSYIDDWYLDIADTPAKEFISMKKQRTRYSARKTFAILLAAIICVSILAVTAVATGWLPGLFQELKERYPYDEELFEAAAQANTDAVPEVLEIPYLDLSKLVITERYFNGETILVGYNLDAVLPEPVVGIEPEKALLKQIKKGVRASRIAWDEPQPWFDEPPTENAIKYDLPEDAFTMDRMLKSTLSDAEYQKAWDMLKTQGYVCVAVRDIWLGDHIFVNGADTIEAYLADGVSYSDRTTYTTEQGTCIRLDPLPEDVRKMDTVTVAVDVRSSVQYWYMDLNGEGRIYYDNSNTQTEQLSFELERSEDNG